MTRQLLMVLGGSLFMFLGLLHGWNLFDLSRPRHFAHLKKTVMEEMKANRLCNTITNRA